MGESRRKDGATASTFTCDSVTGADEAYRKSGFGIVAIIGAIVSALFLIGSYSINRWGNVVVTAIQLLLFVVSVLIRKDIIKCSNRGIPALLTTIGLLLNFKQINRIVLLL